MPDKLPQPLVSKATKTAIPITLVDQDAFASWRAKKGKSFAKWLEVSRFSGVHGTFCPVLDGEGNLTHVVAGLGRKSDASGSLLLLWAMAALWTRLPKGVYVLENLYKDSMMELAALGWSLGSYRFDAFKGFAKKTGPKKNKKPSGPRLVCPKNVSSAVVARLAAATFLTRDLINTPASHMGPADLAAATRKLGRAHKAKVKVITGKALETGYPAIHAVGVGAGVTGNRAPRLIDLTWGHPNAPKVTLVGKGVCFDSGGLNLKPGNSMTLMKKDMGGAAHVLGLAALIMGANLPVRLRLLIPAVENSVSSRAMRPLDVLETAKGLSVEVGNTDAEGRLVLADALHLACREKPGLLIDCATLTGAARAALGPDIPAVFSSDDALARELQEKAMAIADPLWPLPLWRPYGGELKSPVADLNNVTKSPHGGAISAALFLSKFVEPGIPWLHLDMMAWNVSPRAGRPSGGEAMGLRALFCLIQSRFGQARKGRSSAAS